MTRRVLAIGLDGYEQSLGRDLMVAGELPALAGLYERSARFLLDHGAAQRTGLAWEHVSSGLSPEAARRWAAVAFDPETYTTWQEGTRLQPFPARLAARTVVFDPPYFDLARAPRVRGVVDWGAHDPGAAAAARPAGLLREIESRVGPYPAKPWIYGLAWPSPERAREMGAALTRATEARARAARWVLAERLPDWDLALVVVSELHSAIEGLWHGVDPTHPLHDLPSSPPAGQGLRAVYRAVDRLVGDLAGAFDEATLVVFATGGMGPNRSDVASMVLLPELLFRHAFTRALLRAPGGWSDAPGLTPILGPDEPWSVAVNALLPDAPPPPNGGAQRTRLGALMRRLRRGDEPPRAEPLRLPLGWMPATRYQPYWHRMPAFALPSFYDGRIRINLAGRERAGMVPLEGYAAMCDAIEALVRGCRDPLSGEGVVEVVERPDVSDPRTLEPTQSDLVVVWRGAARAFDHPVHGRIGPVPLRRPGGHTGPYGIAYLAGPGIEPGDRGVRSAFDVVPTIVELLGEGPEPGISGRSLLGAREPAAI